MSKNEAETSDLIAAHLARFWSIVVSGEIGEYIADVYGVRIVEEPKVSSVYIGESVSGDFEELRIHISDCPANWLMDDSGLRRGEPVYALDTTRQCYNIAMFVFFYDDSRLLVWERLGSLLHLRRVHPIELNHGQLCVGECTKFRFFGGKVGPLVYGSPSVRNWPGWGSG